MDTTSESLLIQLKSPNCSGSIHSNAWSRFVNLYTPLVFYWARKTGLQSEDASDLVQEVMAIVVQKLPNFQYDRSRSFRGWLRTITLNKYRELIRKKSLNQVDASNSFFGKLADEKQAETAWDIDYARQLVTNAARLMQSDFAPETWTALESLLSTGQSVGEIAKATGVSTWTLYSARARLFSRLRTELDGLLD